MAQKGLAATQALWLPLSTHCSCTRTFSICEELGLRFPLWKHFYNQNGKTSTKHPSPSTLWHIWETSSSQSHRTLCKGLCKISSVSQCRVLVPNLVKQKMSSLTANPNHPQDDCTCCSHAFSFLNVWLPDFNPIISLIKNLQSNHTNAAKMFGSLVTSWWYLKGYKPIHIFG